MSEKRRLRAEKQQEQEAERQGKPEPPKGTDFGVKGCGGTGFGGKGFGRKDLGVSELAEKLGKDIYMDINGW